MVILTTTRAYFLKRVLAQTSGMPVSVSQLLTDTNEWRVSTPRRGSERGSESGMVSFLGHGSTYIAFRGSPRRVTRHKCTWPKVSFDHLRIWCKRFRPAWPCSFIPVSFLSARRAFASLSRSLSESLAATAVWEYSHYPLDIQMKAKPDHGMDLSGKTRRTKGDESFPLMPPQTLRDRRSIF